MLRIYTILIAEDLKWWDLSIDEINTLIPVLTCGDLEYVKAVLKEKI